MLVIKRDGSKQEYDPNKIKNAIKKAFISVKGDWEDTQVNQEYLDKFIKTLNVQSNDRVEDIQDKIEDLLMEAHHDVAKSYILYREKHKELRFIKERSEYIDECSVSKNNTATLSEVDENANVQNKNVATIEAETYKSLNKEIQRYKVTKKLQELFPDSELDKEYINDLAIKKIIYVHDEASSPVPKPYCGAFSLYPFLLHGTSSLDGLKTGAPTNLTSFCGQFNNLVFLLSSQYKGAVAFGEFFNVFYYYCVKEWGEKFWEKENTINICGGIKQKTISDTIEQAFQNIVYTINQPAGNRSYQSPWIKIDNFYPQKVVLLK